MTGCITDFLLEFCFLHAVQIFRSHPNAMVVTTRKVIEVYCIYCMTHTLVYMDFTDDPAGFCDIEALYVPTCPTC